MGTRFLFLLFAAQLITPSTSSIRGMPLMHSPSYRVRDDLQSERLHELQTQNLDEIRLCKREQENSQPVTRGNLHRIVMMAARGFGR